MNIGNIHFRQQQYLQAVKMYRMALDQTPQTHQAVRNRLLQNIAHAFVRLGQYADAATAYGHVLDNRPVRDLGGVERKVAMRDFPTAFNALLCHFALGGASVWGSVQLEPAGRRGLGGVSPFPLTHPSFFFGFRGGGWLVVSAQSKTR